MLVSNIYIEAANGFRLYTVVGSTDTVTQTLNESLLLAEASGGAPLAKFTAAFLIPPATDDEGKAIEGAKPAVELRSIYAQADRVRVVEQAAGWPVDFDLSDQTGRENVEQGAPTPA